MLAAGDPLPSRPQRVLVAGVTGSGKSTLARRIAARLELPYVEIDSLYHGPGWVPREEFEREVGEFARGDSWVTEWQYRTVRAMLADRADTLVWLDHPTWIPLFRVLRRTVRRSWGRTVLWNGNVEPPPRSVFADPDNILRWAWQTRHSYRTLVPELENSNPNIQLVRLRGQCQVEAWLGGLSSGPS
ncbi:MAG TPA: AAA family ATPase [Galbitalea sp.]|jgi:adenylate kinase family enzyme|nr:AAA family ATPase [Galbitalea sp.]